jgi:hypothetical protein
MSTARQPRRIQVKKLPSASYDSKSNRELFATICYYFPQYTLVNVRQLPFRDVMLLLKTAHKMEAVKYKNLTQIAASPHSKKGEGVKKLMDHYSGIIKGK